MTPLDVRLRLLAGGFVPTPVHGKAPVIKGWQHLLAPSREEVSFWTKSYPDARSTGVLTRSTPAFDIDILDELLAEEVERLAVDLFAEHGDILPRIGQAPKRLIPFRTDEPFGKISVRFMGPGFVKEQKLEFLSDGQQCVVHGLHPDTGKPYQWPRGAPGKREELPYIREADARRLIDEAMALLQENGYRVIGQRPQRLNGYDTLPQGPAEFSAQRRNRSGREADWSYYEQNLIDHDTLYSYTMALLRGGLHDAVAVRWLRAKLEMVDDPDTMRKRRRIAEVPGMVSDARSKIDRDELQENLKQAPEPPPLLNGGLDEILTVFNKWLMLPDVKPILAVLGAVAANRLPGDPVWLGLIAPPSSAKTEILAALSDLSFVHQAATLTPAALLSGTPQKQHRAGAKGGLLRAIGDFGILVMKDFTSILAMRLEARNEVMAALREIYDGAWTRQLGTEGGRTLTWQGKMGTLFGCTESYDEYRAVVAQLGDRFLLMRLKPDFDLQYDKSLAHAGPTVTQMRKEMRDVVKAFLEATPQEPTRLDATEHAELKKTVHLAVRLRAHIGRDRYNREIEIVHQPEGPGRLVLALEQLFAGLTSISVERLLALNIIKTVALDSAPQARRMVFEQLSAAATTTRDIALALDYPTVTVRRALEECAVQGLAVRLDERQGTADQWTRGPHWRDV